MSIFRKKIKFLLLFLFVPIFAGAFSVDKIPNVPVRDDFVLFPAKIEMEMSSGGEAFADIKVLNRSGERSDFYIGLENKEAENGIDFKAYSTIDKSIFSLEHGEQADIKLHIKLPLSFNQKNAGGIVFVSSERSGLQKNSGTKILARLGSVVNIKVVEKKQEDESLDINYFLIIFILLISFYFLRKWKRN